MINPDLLQSEIDRTKKEMDDVQSLHYQDKVMDRIKYYTTYQLLKTRLYNLIKLKKK